MDKNLNANTGFVFKKYKAPDKSIFDQLLEIFKELVTHTSGDVDEALEWLKQLDNEYGITTPEYTFENFIEELKEKGYLREEIQPNGKGALAITAKTEREIRQRALNQIFGKLRKSGAGNHKTSKTGIGDEKTGEFRNYQFGDSFEQVSVTESLRNAQINHGINDGSNEHHTND